SHPPDRVLSTCRTPTATEREHDHGTRATTADQLRRLPRRQRVPGLSGRVLPDRTQRPGRSPRPRPPPHRRPRPPPGGRLRPPAPPPPAPHRAPPFHPLPANALAPQIAPPRRHNGAARAS